MTNMIETVRKQLADIISKALTQMARDTGTSTGDALPAVNEALPAVNIEVPKQKGFGDFSSNIAMQAAKVFKQPPSVIAKALCQSIKAGGAGGPGGAGGTYLKRVECAGPGFLNFFLDDKWLYDTVLAIQAEQGDYGRSVAGAGQKVMVEFVSANPTGPLHMGNARGGALGDCIAGVLEAAGYDVCREYFINDSGNQIEKFGQSLEARYLQLFPGYEAIVFPEDGYHGNDITEHAAEYARLNGDKLLNADSSERRKALSQFALKRNLESIRKDLEDYGIRYDVWFSEQQLYESGEVEDAINFLKSQGYTYEKDGAVWFRASDFGAEKDEVIVRSNGAPTYLASDIAYHRNKFLKRGFDRVVNLLGADHHGHSGKMKAVVKALGIDPGRLDIVIYQLVRLYRDGEIARMSKRSGKTIALCDLLDEVGRDAARFFFNTKAAGSHLDFDLDLAVRQSNENPVYYVQYAHARICSMIRILAEDGIIVPPAADVDLSLLAAPEEIELMKGLAEYPEEVAISAQTLEPSRLTRYAVNLAALFHSFYKSCRVKGEEAGLLNARLLLVDSTHIVLKNLLNLLKISAPERM